MSYLPLDKARAFYAIYTMGWGVVVGEFRRATLIDDTAPASSLWTQRSVKQWRGWVAVGVCRLGKVGVHLAVVIETC